MKKPRVFLGILTLCVIFCFQGCSSSFFDGTASNEEKEDNAKTEMIVKSLKDSLPTSSSTVSEPDNRSNEEKIDDAMSDANVKKYESTVIKTTKTKPPRIFNNEEKERKVVLQNPSRHEQELTIYDEDDKVLYSGWVPPDSKFPIFLPLTSDDNLYPVWTLGKKSSRKKGRPIEPVPFPRGEAICSSNGKDKDSHALIKSPLR